MVVVYIDYNTKISRKLKSQISMNSVIFGMETSLLLTIFLNLTLVKIQNTV